MQLWSQNTKHTDRKCHINFAGVAVNKTLISTLWMSLWDFTCCYINEFQNKVSKANHWSPNTSLL